MYLNPYNLYYLNFHDFLTITEDFAENQPICNQQKQEDEEIHNFHPHFKKLIPLFLVFFHPYLTIQHHQAPQQCFCQ